jgi:predicted RNase H-like HicB family nuclease
MVIPVNRYSIEIFFSKEDEGFIAIVPELPGCSAFGTSEVQALEEVKVAMQLWIDTARREGRKIPEPHPEHYISRLSEIEWDNIDGTIAQH